MAARKLTKTRHPGIYQRENRYVVIYYVAGKQRREYVRTLKEALALKASRVADRNRGELQEESRIPFRTYAEEWIGRYQGNGRRGFTDDTREDYRRDLARYAYPFFDDRLGRSVSAISPRDVANWIAWLCDPKAHDRALRDATVRRIASPVRACLATARREGLIRHNPLDGSVLPHRPEVEEDEAEAVKALTREQLAAFLGIVHPRHRLLFRFLAATGVRWSEVAALRWRDLELDGSERGSRSDARSGGSAGRTTRPGSSRRRRSTAGARSRSTRRSSSTYAATGRLRRGRATTTSCSPPATASRCAKRTSGVGC